jgi:hypothetical protein
MLTFCPSRKIARAKAIRAELLKKAQREGKAADLLVEGDIVGLGLMKREKGDSEPEQH